MEPTEDPTVFITARGPDSVAYRTVWGEQWVIVGRCIACGECEVGADNPNLVWTGVPVGEPGACLDTTFGVRRDIPVRPEISQHPHCTLRGKYL